MITEDYVSFETAKLLKEKGFDADIDLWYNSDGEIFHLYHYDYNATKHFACVECPTLQMARKWLREDENVDIEISVYSKGFDGTLTYCANIRKNGSWLIIEQPIIEDTYEQACEAAIKYCLENLI